MAIDGVGFDSKETVQAFIDKIKAGYSGYGTYTGTGSPNNWKKQGVYTFSNLAVAGFGGPVTGVIEVVGSGNNLFQILHDDGSVSRHYIRRLDPQTQQWNGWVQILQGSQNVQKGEDWWMDSDAYSMFDFIYEEIYTETANQYFIGRFANGCPSGYSAYGISDGWYLIGSGDDCDNVTGIITTSKGIYRVKLLDMDSMESIYDSGDDSQKIAWMQEHTEITSLSGGSGGSSWVDAKSWFTRIQFTGDVGSELNPLISPTEIENAYAKKEGNIVTLHVNMSVSGGYEFLGLMATASMPAEYIPSTFANSYGTGTISSRKQKTTVPASATKFDLSSGETSANGIFAIFSDSLPGTGEKNTSSIGCIDIIYKV